jgi:hypothetical protein
MRWLTRRRQRDVKLAVLGQRITESDQRLARILSENLAEIFKDQYGRLCVAFPQQLPWSDVTYLTELPVEVQPEDRGKVEVNDSGDSMAACPYSKVCRSPLSKHGLCLAYI